MKYLSFLIGLLSVSGAFGAAGPSISGAGGGLTSNQVYNIVVTYGSTSTNGTTGALTNNESRPVVLKNSLRVDGQAATIYGAVGDPGIVFEGGAPAGTNLITSDSGQLKVYIDDLGDADLTVTEDAVYAATFIGNFAGSGSGLSNNAGANLNQFAGYSRLYNVMSYGAVGDGIFDDTVAIRAAYAAAAANGEIGTVYYPEPSVQYKQTGRVSYTNLSSGNGIHVLFEQGGRRGNASVGWYGAVGEVMYHFVGVNASLIEGMELDGGSLAKGGVWVDAYNVETPGAPGSSGVSFRRCTFNRFVGTNSFGISAGHTNLVGTVQVSEILCENVIVQGNPGNDPTTSAGFVAFDGGNVKVFTLRDCVVSYLTNGVKLLANGPVLIENLKGGGNDVDVVTGSTSLTIKVANIEGSQEFLDMSTGASGIAGSIEGVQWTGICASNDVVITTTAGLSLKNNVFTNDRTTNSVPVINLNYGLFTDPGAGGVTSSENMFTRATFPPFADSSGYWLCDNTGFYSNVFVNLASEGDIGGIGGALVKFEKFDKRGGTNFVRSLSARNHFVVSTNVLFASSAGKVGVGTTTPAFTLQVNAAGNYGESTDGSALAIVNPSVTTKKIYLGYDASVGADGSGFIQSINQGVANTPLMLNPGGGNVGIGTIDPQRKLQVGSAANNDYIRIATDSRSYDFGIGDENGDDKFVIYDATAAANRLTITTAGNVGIGTTTPGAKLEVAGDIRETNSTGYVIITADSAYGSNRLTGNYWAATNGNFFTNGVAIGGGGSVVTSPIKDTGGTDRISFADNAATEIRDEAGGAGLQLNAAAGNSVFSSPDGVTQFALDDADTGSGGSATFTAADVIIANGSTLKTVGETTIGAGGINNDGNGLKHARVTTGSVNAASTALVTITWGTAFADANYTVQASVVEATTSSLSMSVVHVESVSASAVTVRVINNAAGALTGTVHVMAIHD